MVAIIHIMGNKSSNIKQVIIKGYDSTFDLQLIEQLGISIKYINLSRSSEFINMNNMYDIIQYEFVPLNTIMVKIINGDIAGTNEWAFGLSFINHRLIYISNYRLKQQYYQTDDMIKECVDFYGKTIDELVFSTNSESHLIRYVLIHELGHILTDREFHCRNTNCIMNTINSIVDLTKNQYYCQSCLNKIRKNL